MTSHANRLPHLLDSLRFDQKLYGNNPGRSTLDFPAAIRIVESALTERDDLVAALRAIVAEGGPSAGLDDEASGTINAMSRIARAALAKVEG